MCLTVVGCVMSVDPERGEAVVAVQGAARPVSVAPLVLDGVPPRVGDWVLIHTGMAVATIDESEARELEALSHQVGKEEPWPMP